MHCWQAFVGQQQKKTHKRANEPAGKKKAREGKKGSINAIRDPRVFLLFGDVSTKKKFISLRAIKWNYVRSDARQQKVNQLEYGNFLGESLNSEGTVGEDNRLEIIKKFSSFWYARCTAWFMEGGRRTGINRRAARNQLPPRMIFNFATSCCFHGALHSQPKPKHQRTQKKNI